MKCKCVKILHFYEKKKMFYVKVKSPDTFQNGNYKNLKTKLLNF